VSNELGRALIAATLKRAGAKGIPALTRQVRDGLVVQISTMIAGAKLALGGWLTKTAFETLSPLLTSKGIRQRSDLSNMVSPPAGDILKYQVRGEAIRALIKDTIKATQDDVILFAHSLGGVACVDLLVSTEILQVSHLITVGSQVPYLYEIDALWSLRPGMKLPDTFGCRWLNVYDRSDFLSYGRAERRFFGFCSGRRSAGFGRSSSNFSLDNFVLFRHRLIGVDDFNSFTVHRTIGKLFLTGVWYNEKPR